MTFEVNLKLSVDTLQLLAKQRKLTGNDDDAIIGRALRQLEAPIEEEYILLTPEKPENLRHTNVLSGQVDGNKIEKSTWASLVVTAHRAASKRLSEENSNKLKDISTSYIKDECSDGKQAYEFIEDLGFCIRKVEAIRSWQQALFLAQKLNMPISVAFEWRDKADSKFIGRKGKIEWVPA